MTKIKCEEPGVLFTNGRFAQQLPDNAAETQSVTELPSYRIPLH